MKIVNASSLEGKQLIGSMLYGPTNHRRRSPHQQRVDEFMRNAKQELPDSPCDPDKAVKDLRVRLMVEEAFLELFEAMGYEVCITYCQGEPCVEYKQIRATADMPLVADALADASVVLTGTMSAFGISDVELLEEVDKSNLSKFDLPECPDHPGKPMTHSGNGNYVCLESVTERHRDALSTCGKEAKGPYRASDGKWVKGTNYRPGDFEAVLCRQHFHAHPEEAKEAAKEANRQFVETVRPYVDSGAISEVAAKSYQERLASSPCCGAPETVRITVKAGGDTGERCMDATEAMKTYLKDRYPPDLLERAKEQLVALKEFEAAAVLVAVMRKHGQLPSEPPPSTSAMYTAKDHIARWTSGGQTSMCGNCKTPLSDELVRRLGLDENRTKVFPCPECQQPLIAKDIVNA